VVNALYLSDRNGKEKSFCSFCLPKKRTKKATESHDGLLSAGYADLAL
jgi:hypothetical protein